MIRRVLCAARCDNPHGLHVDKPCDKPFKAGTWPSFAEGADISALRRPEPGCCTLTSADIAGGSNFGFWG